MKNTEKYILKLFSTKGESALLDLKYIPNVDLDFVINNAQIKFTVTNKIVGE